MRIAGRILIGFVALVAIRVGAEFAQVPFIADVALMNAGVLLLNWCERDRLNEVDA